MEYLNETILIAGVFAPFFAALVLALGGNLMPRLAGKIFGFFGFGFSLFASLYMLALYLCGESVSVDTHYFGEFSLNGISLIMYLLAGIAGFCAYWWSLKTSVENSRTFNILLLFMQSGLMGMFTSQNILWMYAFHEFALVPTFIAICIWGGANKKAVAMEMAIYLTLGALIALIGVIMLASPHDAYTFNLSDLKIFYASAPLEIEGKNTIFALLLIGLGALVSLFPLHSWAPKTYNAAPAPFAMLHAGVLKKFGLYFLVQVALPLLGDAAVYWGKYIAIFALCNLILIGLCTMAQKDLKLMVSYSSVSHMGLCFLGIAAMSGLGVGGCVLLMFGHGLSVAALFICADLLNKRFGTLDMQNLGGIYKRMPVFTGLFAAAIFANIGLPGFANFWGELSIFVSLWTLSPWICAAAVSGIIISAIYGLRALANVCYGSQKDASKGDALCDITWGERLPLLVLLLALLLVGFAPKLVTDKLNGTLQTVEVYNNLTLSK